MRPKPCPQETDITSGCGTMSLYCEVKKVKRKTIYFIVEFIIIILVTSSVGLNSSTNTLISNEKRPMYNFKIRDVGWVVTIPN